MLPILELMGKKQAALGFIFITILIDIVGIGLIIPIVPELIMELTDKSNSEAAFHWRTIDCYLCNYAIPFCSCIRRIK